MQNKSSIVGFIKDGKIQINEVLKARFCERHNGKWCDVVVREQKRSVSQLAYIHVLFQLIADHTGATKEEVKTIEKRRHLTPHETQMFGQKYLTLPSLSDIKKEAMMEFIERVLADCAFLEIRVPTREELGYMPR